MDKIINKKNFYWCIFYAVFLVFGGQIVIYYLYKDSNFNNEKFISDEIKNEKIINTDTLHFTPGKGVYCEIELSNGKKYPLFLENNENEKLISLNSFINKRQNEREFEIANNSKTYKFKIKSLKSGEIVFRLIVFLIFLPIGIATIYRYGLTNEISPSLK
jgi:hypothetical protein